MIAIDALFHELQQLIPGIQATYDPAQLSTYALDGLLPRLVVTPGSSQEIAQIVALANQHNLTTLARGGGSHMHLGAIPASLDIMIETGKLTRMLEHEAPDLTCQVEAGLTLAGLQAMLAQK